MPAKPAFLQVAHGVGSVQSRTAAEAIIATGEESTGDLSAMSRHWYASG